MGAAVPLAFLNTLVGPNPPALLEWDVLQSPSLYNYLSSDQILRHPSALSLASSVCKHTLVTRLLPTLYRKILEFSNPQLSANILQLLRVFFELIWAERIPYAFIYQGTTEKQSRGGQEFRFRKQVSCVFHYKGSVKPVQVTIPQGDGFDMQAEWDRLVSEVARGVDSLRDHLRTQKDTVLLLSSHGDLVDLPYLMSYFHDDSAHQRLHLHVVTTECDLAGDLSCFLISLVHWYSGLPSPLSQPLSRAKHAALCLLTVLLSSPLYYSKKQGNSWEYRRSPALDILNQLQPEVASSFTRSLLNDVIVNYHWLPSPSPSFLSKLWTSGNTQDNYARNQTGAAAVIITELLFSSQGAFRNVFRGTELGDVNGRLYAKLLEDLQDPAALRLLVLLVRHNPGFRNFFTSSSEQDRYLPPICQFLYQSPLKNAVPRLHLLLSLLVILSNDASFVLYLNKNARVGTVSWLTDYHTDNISLGSLLLLSVLRVFRDNINSGNAYLHVISTVLLYNLGRNSVELHEVTAQSVLQTLRILYTRWKKTNSVRLSELLDLYLDLYGNLLHHTYKHNPWLVYMTLHEADLFLQLQGRGKVVEKVLSLIEHFKDKVEVDDGLAAVKEGIKVYTISDLSFGVLRGVSCFELASQDTAWEEWLLPQTWTHARQEKLLRLEAALFPLQEL